MLRNLFENLFIKPNPKEKIMWRYEIEYSAHFVKNPHISSDTFYTHLLKKIKKYIHTTSIVLDMGSGLGRVAIDVTNCGAAKVIGIDSDKDFIFEADCIAKNHRKNILSYPARGNCSFIIGNATTTPFKKDYFSVVTNINLIDRVKEPKKIIQEIHRVLKPKGIMVLSDPYDWYDEITPKENQVKSMKELIKPSLWKLLYEEDNIPYNLQVNPRRITSYKNHLLIFEKK